MPPIKVPRERFMQLWACASIAGALIGFRLVDIQVLRHDYYKQAAERNRTQIIYQNAPRGKIITSDDVVIAGNEPSFSLIFLPGRFNDAQYVSQLARDFASRLSMDYSFLLEVLQHSFDHGTPVRLAENLSTRSMFALSELKTLYPGIDLVVETKRSYPYGAFASHLLGYMGSIDPRDWKNLRKEGRYHVDSKIGRSGIENLFERDLKGKDGGLYLEVDSKGRLHRILQTEPWLAGSDIHLTLDYQAQKAAETGLKDSVTKSGAVIAIDPQNGDILALASVPDFDPNMFVVFSDSHTATYTKALPEYNFATQGQFAPGSVFKIITAAAALESGQISIKDSFYCPGYYNAGNRIFKCWEKRGHGSVSFIEAMAQSCDVYFYNVGLKISPSLIEDYENQFRLGIKTGILLPGEKPGYVFGPKERAKRKSYWFVGDTLNLAIGQGEILVTPIQMAQVVGAVSNGGFFWQPQYVRKITDPYGRTVSERQGKLLSRVTLKPETWDNIRAGLHAVIENGTGSACKIKGLTVYGKSGTAQTSLKGDNAWFVAYAEEPGKKARIAVAVLVQQAGHGGTAAAPIAKQVILSALRWDDKTGAPIAAAPAALPAGTTAAMKLSGALVPVSAKNGVVPAVAKSTATAAGLAGKKTSLQDKAKAEQVKPSVSSAAKQSAQKSGAIAQKDAFAVHKSSATVAGTVKISTASAGRRDTAPAAKTQPAKPEGAR